MTISTFLFFFCLRCRRTAWSKICWLNYFLPLVTIWSGEFVLQPTYNYQPGSTKKCWMSLLEKCCYFKHYLVFWSSTRCQEKMPLLMCVTGCVIRCCLCYLLYWHWGELVWLAVRSSLSVEKSMELMRIRSSDEGEDGAQVTMIGGNLRQGSPCWDGFFLQSTVISSETQKKEGWCWPTPNLRW